MAGTRYELSAYPLEILNCRIKEDFAYICRIKYIIIFSSFWNSMINRGA